MTQTKQGQKVVFETIRLTMKKLIHETFANNPDVANTVGKELSIALFEKKHGSTLCSYTQVGKFKTEQRIRDCNETSGNLIRLAMLMLEKMSNAEIKELISVKS